MRKIISFEAILTVAMSLSVIHAFIPSSTSVTTLDRRPMSLRKQRPTRMAPLCLAADAWTGGGDTTIGASRLSSGGGYGSVEQIEFKIYSDGRVEELVRGVKGNNCHKVTEKINEQLGEIVSTRPTEEMYEQELQVTQTLYNTDSVDSGDWQSSTW
jgi:Protein of unknown function (DUF2997)